MSTKKAISAVTMQKMWTCNNWLSCVRWNISSDADVYTKSDIIDEIVGFHAEDATENAEESETESNDSQESQPEKVEILSSHEMVAYAERMKQTVLSQGNAALFTKASECLMLIEEEIAKKTFKQTTVGDYFKSKLVHLYIQYCSAIII